MLRIEHHRDTKAGEDLLLLNDIGDGKTLRLLKIVDGNGHLLSDGEAGVMGLLQAEEVALREVLLPTNGSLETKTPIRHGYYHVGKLYAELAHGLLENNTQCGGE